jgi:DNA repair protein RecO
LDTLNLIDAKIYESGKGFPEVEEVKTINSFIDIKKSYELSLTSYYFVELIYRTLEDGVGSEEILNLLIYCLKKLAENPNNRDEVVAFFELRFMGILGYQLNTDICIKCGKTIMDNLNRYTLDFGRGGFLCERCFGLGKQVSRDIFMWIKAARTHGLDKISLISNVIGLRAATRAFLNTHLESKLKSLELI